MSKPKESTHHNSLKMQVAGLPAELTVAVGARVVLTKNNDVSDGLVNSAAGSVTGFSLHITLPQSNLLSPSSQST